MILIYNKQVEIVITKSINKIQSSMQRLMALKRLVAVIQITAMLQNIKIKNEHMRI